MTQENRETMQRAIGVIDGVAWMADEKTSEALINVLEMLEGVLNSEDKQ